MERTKKTVFGEYLVNAIREANMSQAEFIDKVGLARPYFYDILKNSPPSEKVLEKMYAVLNKSNPDSIHRSTFMDMAYKCRGKIPADIFDLMMAHPDRWDDIREVLKKMF